MALDLESDTLFSNVLAGLPRVAEVIATVPEEKRSLALDAAQQGYLRIARGAGYDEAEAQEWTSAIMVRLRAESAREAASTD
jgi:hypothetical protein